MRAHHLIPAAADLLAARLFDLAVERPSQRWSGRLRYRRPVAG